MFDSLLLISTVPASVLIPILFIFGAIIGSFLNVVLYRFHTGKSLQGYSHCLSCARRLSPFELVPLLSYLAIRGRCFACRSYVPVRYFLVELLTAVLYVSVLFATSTVAEALLYFVVFTVLVLITVYDLRHMIIPDEFVVALGGVAMVYKGYEIWHGVAPTSILWDITAALLAAAFFFTLWYVSKGTWIGLGDAKLVIPLALIVGSGSTFSLVVLSFWIGSVIGVALLFGQKIQRRATPHLRFLPQTLTMKSAVPFAPFLVLSFLAIVYFHIDVISLLRYG